MEKPDLSNLKIDDIARSGGRASRSMRWVIVLVAVLIGVVAITYFILPGPPVVAVAEARATATESGSTVLLNASGYVTPRRRSTVSAEITGRVTEVYAEEGMSVAEGQVLARLDDSDIRRQFDVYQANYQVVVAALKEIEVNLVNANREVNRNRELFPQGFVSEQALEQSETAAEALAARLNRAREEVISANASVQVMSEALANYTIRAPFAGIVVSKDAQVGEMVSPVSAGGGYTRTGIATIVDMQSLEIEVDVNESYIARVRAEQPVEATLDAYPDWKIPCRVLTIIPTADRQKATVKVRISFNELDPRLLPDMGVKVAFLAEAQPDQVAAREIPRAIIPRAAVKREGESSIVFLITGDRVERRAIRLGSPRGSDIEVLAGVHPGDRLVVRGLEKLKDGQTVKLEQSGS